MLFSCALALSYGVEIWVYSLVWEYRRGVDSGLEGREMALVEVGGVVGGV